MSEFSFYRIYYIQEYDLEEDGTTIDFHLTMNRTQPDSIVVGAFSDGTTPYKKVYL